MDMNGVSINRCFLGNKKPTLQDVKEARDALELRLTEAATDNAGPTSAALLAIHAISTKKWDHARRLVYQGGFTAIFWT